MDQQTTGTEVLGTEVLGGAIVEWLADEALQDSEPATLCNELCLRLRAAGLPVVRFQVAFRVLHPLYDASTLNWTAGKGVVRQIDRTGRAPAELLDDLVFADPVHEPSPGFRPTAGELRYDRKFAAARRGF